MAAVGVVLMVAACVLAHEAGHVLAGRCHGFRLRSVLCNRRGIGVGLERRSGRELGRWASVHISLGGPLASFELSAAAHVYGLTTLALGSLALGLANLVPFFPHSDGCHIVDALRKEAS